LRYFKKSDEVFITAERSLDHQYFLHQHASLKSQIAQCSFWLVPRNWKSPELCEEMFFEETAGAVTDR